MVAATASIAVATAPCISCYHVNGRHAHASPNPLPIPRRTASPSPLRRRRVLAQAKFEKFDNAADVPPLPPGDPKPETAAASEQQELDEDSDLPSDLEGAIRQSSQASALFVSSGGMRAIVELLIPQLLFLDDEGAQAELWELSRIFLESFIEESGNQRVKAIFPDAGAAALLKHHWKDAKFGFSSLSDRKPVDNEDEVIIMVVPDYQMLEYVERIAKILSEDPHSSLLCY